jgi:hypothetical protein
MYKLAALLLLIGGAVHAIPQLYAFLTDVTGGVPLIQIIVGIASVLTGVVLFGKSDATVSRGV